MKKIIKQIDMRKYIITAELRKLEWQVNKGEISYSRMIEILCEKADEYAELYHKNELSKLRLDAVSDAVCSCIPDKMEEIGWYQKRHCNRCHKQTDC